MQTCQYVADKELKLNENRIWPNQTETVVNLHLYVSGFPVLTHIKKHIAIETYN
jgi:hypothetical protein